MDDVAALLDSALGHHQAGRLDEAETLYRRLLAHQPDHPDALHLLGVLAHQRGRHDQAIDLIGRALARDPSRPTYHNNRGAALRALGRLDEAEAAYRAALRLRHDYADAHSNLGVVRHERGDLDAARAHIEAALRLRPDHADALYNAGNLLRDLGRPDRAVDFYRAALAADPARADALDNLGLILLDLGRAAEAEAAYRVALAARPDAAEVHAKLGALYAQMDRPEEAAGCLRAAARLRPEDPLARLRAAAACPAVFPDVAAIDRYRAELEAAVDACAGRPPGGDPAAVGCFPSFNLAHQGRNNRRLKGKFAAVFAPAFPTACPRGVGPGPPKVGFVVTYPHEGIFLRCLAGVVDRLTPGRFRPVVFGSIRGLETIRRRVRNPEVALVPVADRLAAAAERIAAERCDLLYHWEVGTDALNYFLPFARLAPVQCTSWGTQVTSGVPAVDYYLSAELIEAAGADDHYTERLVRLATLPTYQERPAPGPADRAEFGLPAGRHLYLCPQSLLKLHPDADGLLAGVLRRDPAGVVVLKRGRWPAPAERLAERLRRTIPDVADRVAFVPWQDAGGYYRLLGVADVVLDTPHFGAGSTTYDILGLGLPLVTLPGEFNVGRYAQACYRKMGFTELIASSAEDYAELAVRLGTDRGERSRVAGRIAEASGVLFEDAEAVREHERFFEAAVAARRG